MCICIYVKNLIHRKGTVVVLKDVSGYIKECENHKEIIIYGAGIAGHLLQRRLEEKYGIKINYFCTSFEDYHIDNETGLEVLNRNQLEAGHLQALYIVALGITYSQKAYEGIKQYLIQIGVCAEDIIVDTNAWIIYEAKPYVDARGKLHVYTLSYHVTKQCNLKCKMCGQLLFGLVPRRSFPSEQIENDMETIFRIIDKIDVLKLIGGEVMVYAKLDQLIDLINRYHEQVGLLEIYTNGVAEPKERLLWALTKYEGKIQVTISDYGELSNAKDAWIRFGKSNNIKINILGFSLKDKNGYKGWIDCTQIEDLGENEETIRQKYNTCWQRLDYVLEDSIIGKCTSFHMINYALKKNLRSDEAVYINSNSSDEEKRKQVLKLGEDDISLDVCKYCIWGSSIRDTLPRYPAAEQLDKMPR